MIQGTEQSEMTLLTDGRLAEQALQRGKRRLGADNAAPALEALQQRRLLAADVGAGAEPRVQAERPAAAEHALARAPIGGGDLDRPAIVRKAAGYSERM